MVEGGREEGRVYNKGCVKERENVKRNKERMKEKK